MDGRVRQPAGAAIETAAPTNTYPCADGKWLCIAGNSDLIFAPADGGDRPAGTGATIRPTRPTALRCANRDALDAAIAAWTRTLPAKEAEALLEAAEVPCSRLYDIADCADDPHFRARRSVQEVTDPLIGAHAASGAGDPAGRRAAGGRGALARTGGRRAHRYVLNVLLGEGRAGPPRN